MNTWDVIVIGAGQLGRSVAARLSENQRRVLLVETPDARDDYHRQQILALDGAPEEPPIYLPTSIDIRRDTARFEKSHQILIGAERVQARDVILTTGAALRSPDFSLAGLPFLSPADALRESPKNVIILGGGPLGVGTALRLASRGASVTLMGRNPSLLPGKDPDLVRTAQGWLEQKGVRLLLGTAAVGAESTSVGVRVRGSQNENVEAEALIVATGLKSDTDHLNLSAAGIYSDNNGIAVDDQLRTSALRVWAAGFGTQLPRLLALEAGTGEIVSENIGAPFFGRKRLVPEPWPWTLPTLPPFASIGMTEPTARSLYKDTVTGTVTLPQKTLETGFLKIIGRKKSGEVLGVHGAGVGTPEAVSYFGLVLRAEISLFDLDEPQHLPFPSNSNVILEALRAWITAAR